MHTVTALDYNKAVFVNGNTVRNLTDTAIKNTVVENRFCLNSANNF